MTLCPVALAVGCKKCPIFSVCPAKGLIGDYPGEGSPAQDSENGDASASDKSE